ncbi:1,3-beta-glucanosyltransferase-1 [Coleophoma crateriformis]|uniref:1,3-beta-glucanosyltransferase n=1 Tax=Coleophoma crateriformis TaxID=565419 RepID=A0A3D8R8W4_9HELO|nr:1,3-beta-glucanosyltransferase-1 [Coleophoma crateriformis]
MISLFARAFLVLNVAIFAVAALPTISVKGAKFFAGGKQFFVQGVAYQGSPSDPLVDSTQCNADAALMKTLGTNSIRVYHVNPYVDHSACMKIFDDAGIYIWLDLDTFNTTIVQTAPAWSEEQFIAFTMVMDAFQSFDNLGGFWIGNEVISSASGSPAAPYVKAAVADMKAYLAKKNYRDIPIGYSAADIAELRPNLQNYLACGTDYSQSIDFFGLNSYEWCGDATYQTSGYNNLQAMSEGYSIPIFFSETGCNVGGARTFADQAAIFGSNMIDTWSGSIIYEWVQETNDYGLVTYPNGALVGIPTKIQPDFDNLAGQWASLAPSGVAETAYQPSFSAPACPAPTAGGWLVDGNVALPTLGVEIVAAAAASVKPTSYVLVAPSTLSSAVSSAAPNTATEASGSKTTGTLESTATKGVGSSTSSSSGSSTSGSASATSSASAAADALNSLSRGSAFAGLIFILGVMIL